MQDQSDDELLNRFTSFAYPLPYEELPAYAVQAAKERLIDALGCAAGAYTQAGGCRSAEIGRSLASPASRPELGGRLLCTRDTVSAPDAAFINACLIRDLDFNDTYPGQHPSDCLGPLLAVAAAVGATAGELITAVVTSYEISLRMTMATRLNRKGWDNGYAVGISTAAAVSRLLGATREQLRHAISLSATSIIPMRCTRAGNLSMWKGAATAFAVQGAVRAAQLAKSGMTGPERPFTGRHGLMDLITGPFEYAELPNEGGDYFIPRAKLKYWPVAYNIQPVVWLGRELRDRLTDRTLVDAHVYTNWSSWRESGSEPAKWDPRSRETADHSAPYVLARVLRYGIIDHHAFEPSAYLDESIRDEMARIAVSVDDEIEAAFPGEIRMRLTASDDWGEVHHIEVVNVLGHEANPMTQPDIAAKFERLVSPLVGTDRAASAFDHWWELEPGDSVDAALDLLAANPVTAN